MLIKQNSLNIFQFHAAEKRLVFFQKTPHLERALEVNKSKENTPKNEMPTDEQIISTLSQKGLNDIKMHGRDNRYPITFTYEGVPFKLSMMKLPNGGIGIDFEYPTFRNNIRGSYAGGQNLGQAIENIKKNIDETCPEVMEKIVQQVGFGNVKFVKAVKLEYIYSCTMEDGRKAVINVKRDPWLPLITLSAQIEGDHEPTEIKTLFSTREGLSTLHDTIVNKDNFRGFE